MAGTTTQKKAAKTAPRPKPRQATAREVLYYWIELTVFEREYALWKVQLPGEKAVRLEVGELDPSDALPIGDVEFVFDLAEFLSAVEEMQGRKKVRGETDEPYGEGVAFGDGFSLEKFERSDYQIVARCGDTLDITAAELRLLASAVERLPVSTPP